MISIESIGNTKVLRLAHGKASALDLELCVALDQHLKDCAVDSSTALVLTGSGSIFSAGVDLLRILADGDAYLAEFLPALNQVLLTLFDFPKPLVAALNGHAIAGGCVMACAADQRLMTRAKGRIGVPELQVGVAFPLVALEIMRSATPTALFPALIYQGLTLDAEAAMVAGMVGQLTSADDLIPLAVAAAEKLATPPADAFALTKRQVQRPYRQRIEDHRVEDEAAVLKIWRSPATRAAIAAYVEKTLKR